MGKHDRCSVGGCSNDKCYPDKYVKRGHVEKLIFHRFPVDPVKKEKWVIAVQKGRKHFTAGNESFVCSNHFSDGKPTYDNPFPTLFLTTSDSFKSSPKKRHPPERNAQTSHVPSKKLKDDLKDKKLDNGPSINYRFSSPPAKTDIEVHFLTGLKNMDAFKLLVNYLSPKASVMSYWKGEKQTRTETASVDYNRRLSTIIKVNLQT